MNLDPHRHKEEILDELNRILAHSLFKGARRSSSFLRYVCEKTLAGESHQIKEFSIAVDAFGLKMTFDQHIDPRIRVEAKRLRDRLHQYYKGPGRDSPLVISMAKGNYVPCFSPSSANRSEPEHEIKEGEESVLLDQRFLIQLTNPPRGRPGTDEAGLFTCMLIHQLFTLGQNGSKSLRLTERTGLQSRAIPLTLTIKEYEREEGSYCNLRLNLKKDGSLIHSRELNIPHPDIRNNVILRSAAEEEAKAILTFCRSVQS